VLSRKIANIISCVKERWKRICWKQPAISLLSIVSKVLERCVFYNNREKLYQVIKTSQHGFIRGKSCVTNLLEVLNYIGSILDVGGQVDAVYLDISKAFDKINHKHLLHKLRMDGFGGSLLQWFQSYLTNRHQRVTAQGSTSTTLPCSYIRCASRVHPRSSPIQPLCQRPSRYSYI
jgi:rRNA processing protein Gar1